MIMQRTTISAILLLALVLTVALGSGPAQASNEIAKKEGLACTVCHDKPGSRLLTDQGKYYETLGSLEGYDQVTAFAECTGCHVRKPGSHKLTATGKRFAEAVHDMAGLKKWLAENPPGLEKSH
jgi:cytochrome c553